MRAHTKGFKEQIKILGRELDSKITYTLNGVETALSSEQLNAVTPSFEGSLLKSVMKQLDIDTNELIPVGTELKYELGLKVNGGYEYLDFGNYVVYSVEKQENTNSYKITCYDKLLYSMQEYLNSPTTYPITIKNYIASICNALGIGFANINDNFVNANKEIPNELYLSEDGTSLGFTFRDILDELAQVTASTICLNANDELEIRYINDTEDTIDEEYLKNINVNFGEKYGPINSIVLSRGGESDNIYLRDEESVELNGLNELKIVENQIMNSNNRSEFLPEILEKLNGLEFYINDFSSTGVCYYELCDKYNIKVGDKIYSCIMLNDEILITQGLVENIYTDLPKESETDYSKSDTTDRRINQAYIIVNKQNQTIEAMTKRVKVVEDELTNNHYTIEQTNTLIQDATEGLKNTLNVTGGSNLLRNPIGIFNDDYWDEIGAEPYTDTYIQNKTGQRSCWLLNNGKHLQTIQVKNGEYTFSLLFEKIIEVANVSLKINDVEYELKEKTEITFNVTDNHITIEFIGDINGCAYLMNLMLNEGNIPQVYSNNANETISDTVMIGKGIQITASGKNAMLDAQADGIRIKNINTDNTTTEFTDKGTITNDLTAHKATISKVLIVNTGTQTLFTKI